MPPHMPRWSPFWTALLSFGGLTPLVRAGQPPPAPSPAPMTAPAGTTTPGKSSRLPSAVEKSFTSGGKVSIESDSMVGVNGQLILRGHVVVRQGNRSIKANQVQ